MTLTKDNCFFVCFFFNKKKSIYQTGKQERGWIGHVCNENDQNKRISEKKIHEIFEKNAWKNWWSGRSVLTQDVLFPAYNQFDERNILNIYVFLFGFIMFILSQFWFDSPTIFFCFLLATIELLIDSTRLYHSLNRKKKCFHSFSALVESLNIKNNLSTKNICIFFQHRN